MQLPSSKPISKGEGYIGLSFAGLLYLEHMKVICTQYVRCVQGLQWLL